MQLSYPYTMGKNGFIKFREIIFTKFFVKMISRNFRKFHEIKSYFFSKIFSHFQFNFVYCDKLQKRPPLQHQKSRLEE